MVRRTGKRIDGDALDKYYELKLNMFIVFYPATLSLFSVIINIYNKKTKGPTLMELFTATRKLKKFFLTSRDVRYVHHG
jgi:hypothetical protein